MYKKDCRLGDNGITTVKLKNKGGYIEAGNGNRTLINSLIGFNNECEYSYELQKLNAIINLKEKPDIISDLSAIRIDRKDALWYRVANETDCIAATLPVYLVDSESNIIDENQLLEIIIEQMEFGVGLLTIHPTANREIFTLARNRMVPITSRGGGIVLRDLLANKFKRDNVYLRILPQIISYSRKHGVTISIGTTFRSSNIFDSNDKAQRMEIDFQLLLAKEISEHGVGVIVESPGHARPKDIRDISAMLKKSGFPVMPLGPIPTDCAVGFDHVSSAIGATIMGFEGCANILAAVTREEHTGGRPTIESTIEAIKTARIAAHIIDIHNLDDTELDLAFARSRSEAATCVIERDSKFCDRCKDLCPLMIR